MWLEVSSLAEPFRLLTEAFGVGGPNTVVNEVTYTTVTFGLQLCEPLGKRRDNV
jgi:hypothetical protein